MYLFKLISLNYTLIIGIILAVLDTFSLPMAKLAYFNNNLLYLIIGIIVSSTQLLIFYKAMSYSSMVILNLTWDLLSDILVTLYGLFILKEILPTKKLFGIMLSLISLGIMNS
jgi:uncharacterized membrane protein